MPKVTIPPPYRGPTSGRAEVAVEGRTVLECLQAVEDEHPGFLPQILAPDGSIHRFVKLFLNGEQIEERGGTALARAVTGGDEVGILAAIAGG